MLMANLHHFHKGQDTRRDKSLRQVAAKNRLVRHVKVIVAATEFCRRDLSHEFKLVEAALSQRVYASATSRCNKI